MLKQKISDLKSSILNNPSFTVKEQMGYSGGIFGNTMGQDCVNTYSKKFMQNFTGIEVKKVGNIESIQTVVDLIASPFMGNYLDKPTKPGRLPSTKRVLKLMPIPFAVASMLLFVVPSTSSVFNYVWCLALTLMFGLVDAFFDMSMNVMSLRMTDNADDRRKFYAVSTLMASLGSMLPGWIVPMFTQRAKDDTSEKWTYFIIALIFCILGVSAMLAPYFTLNEKVKVQRKEKQSVVSWDKETLNAIGHNRLFFIIQIANFFEKIRSKAYDLLLYVYDDVLDNYGMKPIIDMISGALSYGGLAFVSYLSGKFSAPRVMSMGYAYTGTFYLIMALFGINFSLEKVRKNRWIIGILIGLAGLPNNALSSAKKDIIGDSADYMEWYSFKKFGTPIRSEGLIFTVQNICTAISSLIVTNTYYPILDKIGYKSSTVIKGSKKAVQSLSTLKGVYFMFTMFGVVGNFLASAVYLFDNYSGATRAKVLEELKTIRAEAESSVAETAGEG